MGPTDEDNIPAASGSPDASLTQDDSFTATSHAGLTYPWGEAAPGAGETIRIANGISWARIPMPGSLGHINSWLLDDGEGVAVVDTGICLTMCSDAWKALYAGALKDRRITRVIHSFACCFFAIQPARPIWSGCKCVPITRVMRLSFSAPA